MSRFGYVITTYLMTFWIGIAAMFPPSPRLLWNASASVPTGLYLLASIDSLKVGDVVAVRPPTPLGAFMDSRHYLPKGMPLLKHVGALVGQTICRQGLTITIDGEAVATALAHDHAGRALPVWSGCITLTSGQIFLLNPTVSASFDGRYFGALPMSGLIGRAELLFADGHV